MLNLSLDLNALEDQYSSGAYLKRDLQIVRGEGAVVWDNQGRSYIDCVGGQGAANLGHCPLAVVEALQKQMAELISCPELFHNPVRARYQAELCHAAHMARVFLCNSGTEANEGALKIARLKTGRTGIIAMMRGFHGRTMGALSATWNKDYREPFQPLIPDVTHVPYNNIDKLREALNYNTAAVILEVVQGEGGVHPAQDGYLQMVQELCRGNGTLLILDEVQTGFGRTGYLFAHEKDGVQPDLMTVAKSMAGGIPMGAILMRESIGDLNPAAHGSTFGGNPLACAAGLAALDVLRNTDLIERARTRGEQVIEHLRTHIPEKAAREVRGRGFHIGIELRDKVAPILKILQERGVLALPAGPSVLRLLPPLVISDNDLWQVVAVIEETLQNAF
jgi:[amino-group carrier protein]-gamma-(L-lysyl/L-ornithyl)-L-glutamate aminotransferase